jgi:hypothetical protein
MIIALCFVLASSLFCYVFISPSHLQTAEEKNRLAFLRERKDVIYENLRDLLFEYRSGKLPQADYDLLRTDMEEEASALLAEIVRMEWSAVTTGANSRRQARV